MDRRYYEILRRASQDDFYQAINNPEDELYDVLWDLFEAVVIEPAEIFDPQFREQNQFRFRIDGRVDLEFFPEAAYFRERPAPSPYDDDSDAAGIHLKFSILPEMSCLFSVGLQVWGRPERQAFRRIWRQHRRLLSDLFHRAKPMMSTAVRFPSVERAQSLEEALDAYFASADPESYIQLQYPFAEFDETDAPQNFMAYMALLYHAIRESCQLRQDLTELWLERVTAFYAGRLPDLPPPLPCVELVTSPEAEGS